MPFKGQGKAYDIKQTTYEDGDSKWKLTQSGNSEWEFTVVIFSLFVEGPSCNNVSTSKNTNSTKETNFDVTHMHTCLYPQTKPPELCCNGQNRQFL